MSVSQWWRSTASACISGTITKPPPYESAPTLRAVHASAPSPPACAARSGSAATSRPGRETAAISTSPQPSSTSTRYGPIVAAAAPPARAYATQRSVERGARPARPGERQAGLHRDRRDARTGARRRAAHPQRRRACEEHGGEREDQDEPRDDEREPADDRAGRAAEPPRAVDRELGRGRAGEEVARGDRVLELDRREPAAPLDAEAAEERDVRRRPAEPDAPDPAPFRQHDRQRRRGARLVHGRVSNTVSRPAAG